MASDIRNIKSIQVFHTVSKLSSVTRAAEKLNISQSSVSYHIKKLESDLSVTLFCRTPRGLQLTDEGNLFAVHVQRGLSDIQTGIERLIGRAGTLKVALLPMFSSRWLSPRLGTLLERHPELQLSIQNHNNSYTRMVNPTAFADAGIQWGRGQWPQFKVTRLWAENLVVVCSPAYLREHPINRPEDLLACKLLHVDDKRMWEEWFAVHDLPLQTEQSQMILEDRHFQLSSTVNGLGVSLFASWLVENELKRGDLINPFDCDFATSFAYHLVVPKGNESQPVVKQFSQWLMACGQ